MQKHSRSSFTSIFTFACRTFTFSAEFTRRSSPCGMFFVFTMTGTFTGFTYDFWIHLKNPHQIKTKGIIICSTISYKQIKTKSHVKNTLVLDFNVMYLNIFSCQVVIFCVSFNKYSFTVGDSRFCNGFLY